MRCPKCFTTIPEGQQACPKCGTDATVPTPSVAAWDNYPKMLSTADVGANPSIFRTYPGKYMILQDTAITGFAFHNLNRAICVAAEFGWKTISITTMIAAMGIANQHMYALLEKQE